MACCFDGKARLLAAQFADTDVNLLTTVTTVASGVRLIAEIEIQRISCCKKIVTKREQILA
jgi:hypothetical protein